MSNKIVTLQDGSDNIYPIMKSNPNLLDNGWFTVNQKRQTSYSGSGYGVDRWKSSNGRLVLTVNDGYITFANDSAGNSFQRQNLENPLESGKVYTYSIMIRGTCSGYLWRADANSVGIGTSTTLSGTYSDWTIISEDFTSNGEDQQVIVRCNSGYSFDIKAMKLEEGNVSTLHLDKAPDYKTELLRCQRYYQLYQDSSLRPSNMYDCRPVMYKNPSQGTITIDGTTYYYNDANI